METKLTTVALKKNQYLVEVPSLNMFETFCEGYTNHKRDNSLDGWYFTKDLRRLV